MGLRKCMGCMRDYDDASIVCPYCGYVRGTPKREAHYLEPETILEERYIIGKSLGAGGFGIVYLAWDAVLNKAVVIKEYLPAGVATRKPGLTEVVAYDGEKTVQYQRGLEGFIQEGMRVVKLNQIPGIVHVYDCFIANCTAYIVMEYAPGITLRDMLRERGPLPYNEVIEFIVPVLYALDEVHREGIIHRDIAPDNIKIDGGKVTTLLDFGAARKETAINEKSLTAILKPGYAPPEQYFSNGNQGPWTDVYAVGAVMYHAITGRIPEESIERQVKDELKTPSQLGFDIPKPVENALMNALNLRAENRPQSAKAFADALSGLMPVERIVEKPNKNEGALWTKKQTLITAISAAVVAVAIAVLFITRASISSANFGREPMPNVIGTNVNEAKEKIINEIGVDENNFRVKWLDNTDGKPGEVVDQGIQAGYKFDKEDDKDTLVELLAVREEVEEEDKSKDKAEIPTLDGMTEEEAKAALKKAGFTNYTFKKRSNNAYKPGEVCGSRPNGGKTVKKDKAITVYVAKKDSKKSTPTTRATSRATTRPTTKKKVKKTTTTKKETTTKKKYTPTTKKVTTTKKKVTTTKKKATTKPKTTKLKTTAAPKKATTEKAQKAEKKDIELD